MERHFDEELAELHKEILRMGVLAQEAIYQSIEALKNRDLARALEVINRMTMRSMHLELLIDEKCFELIARYQPIAGDLRFITTGHADKCRPGTDCRSGRGYCPAGSGTCR